jgi:outer membrane protein TolC
MKTLILLATTLLLLNAQDLKSLLEASSKNELIQAREQQARSADLTYDATKAAYLPRVDLGATATHLDETGDFDVGETYTAYAKASLTLFDGFKRENLLHEKRQLAASEYADLESFKKSLSLQITQVYYELLNIYGDIDAQKQRRIQLEEELVRQERFFEARIATDEEVERIKAALANADFTIEQLQYNAKSLLSDLVTMTGTPVRQLDKSHFRNPAYKDIREPDAIKAMRLRADALESGAKQSASGYYPTLHIEDTYTHYDYRDANPLLSVERAEKQNRLMAVASMTLFDFSAASKQKEALMAQKYALDKQIVYEHKRTEADINLAKQAIERSKAQIAAAELSLSASEKAFETVKKKYAARVVDYVNYLDALFQKTDALAQLNRAKNTLQLAYAQFYFAAGHDLKEYVK